MILRIPSHWFAKEVVDVTGGSDDEDLVEVNKAVGAFYMSGRCG